MLGKLLSVLIVLAAMAVPFVISINADRSDPLSTNTDTQRMSMRLPPVTPPHPQKTRQVPDFSNIAEVRERKEAFFSYLLPAIQFENSQILRKRTELLRLANKLEAGEQLNTREQRWLTEMVNYYRVNENTEQSMEITDQVALLLRRVDIIPETLVLIQAANESGWGTSRFAQDARNFFGQWCWTAGCGIVPNARPEGQVYEVRLFDSMESSVRSYMRNLNTHFAYQDLRTIRQELRKRNATITATELSAGLMRYSERGEEYIEELNQMIRVNRPIIQGILGAERAAEAARTTELTAN
ncbi:glucosaminidase domain-containing protein [Aliidiomarina celeris]|uniref:glucosaminidase domain-containing protein n=1 Tax=Aliidiomarina celeris TaxID=2249428 RepID=UPI001E413E2E|nr:glucosaminidase domain-containing protein [Aliidiomarina celeris]